MELCDAVLRAVTRAQIKLQHGLLHTKGNILITADLKMQWQGNACEVNIGTCNNSRVFGMQLQTLSEYNQLVRLLQTVGCY